MKKRLCLRDKDKLFINEFNNDVSKLISTTKKSYEYQNYIQKKKN